MGSHPDVKSSYLSSVNIINNGAAPVGPNDVERLLEKAPQVTFVQGTLKFVNFNWNHKINLYS